VLASFSQVTGAVDTALSLPSRLDRGEPSLLAGLRVGIHKGPALAATLDDQLDYFGTTVRDVVSMLAQAGDGELLLTEAVATDLEVAALLHDRGIATEIVPTSLPGHRHLIRVRLDALASAASLADP
jgi:eukaryotic-like serine/threonine-protein kinase